MLLNLPGRVKATRDKRDHDAGRRSGLRRTRGSGPPPSRAQKRLVHLTGALNRNQPCWPGTDPGHRSGSTSPTRAQGPVDWIATLPPRLWYAVQSRGPEVVHRFLVLQRRFMEGGRRCYGRGQRGVSGESSWPVRCAPGHLSAIVAVLPGRTALWAGAHAPLGTPGAW